MKCPVCHGTPKPDFLKHGFQIQVCQSCGHQMVEAPNPLDHVEKTYSDAYFLGGGAGYQDYPSEGEALRSSGRRYASLLQKYTRPGRVLDVGAAAGFILKGFEDCGWEGTGLEPNAMMVAYARERLALSVFNTSLEDFDCGEKFDVVLLIQVIGHFQDPEAALSKSCDLVREGGHILVESWNRKSLTATVCGRSWHEYSPPSVLHWFSKTGLGTMGRNLGLTCIASGRPRKAINGKHAKGILMYNQKGSFIGRNISRMIGMIPDGLEIRYPFDDVFWSLFRKR